jgi:flagellar motor switch protein FliM
MTEEITNDPVLTDDEKDALLDGISSGEVEVHSTKGPAYAAVTPFEVGPRSRIVTDSYPRLQSLNRQFAARVGKQIEGLLNAESTVMFSHIKTCTYNEFSEQYSGLSLLLEFAPKPLDGAALINLNSALVEVLVETFYGGNGNDLSRQDADFFTPGEVNVAALFCAAVIAVTGEVWQPMADFKPELAGPHLSSGVIECIDGGETIIAAEFDLTVAGKVQNFHMIWPVSTVASLLPAFEGQKRERDVAEDARWEQALRSGVVESIISISSNVGKTRMTLGEVADLKPGDVITISNPRKSTVYAGRVPILEGRFGVHDGRHAIEATQWLEPRSGAGSTNSKQ